MTFEMQIKHMNESLEALGAPYRVVWHDEHTFRVTDVQGITLDAFAMGQVRVIEGLLLLAQNQRQRADDMQAAAESAEERADTIARALEERLAPPTSAVMGEAEAIGREVGKLVDEKDRAYGRAFDKAGQFFALLYPEGIAPAQYTDALGLVRMFDKMQRLVTHADAFGEDPYEDLLGYVLLMVRRRRALRAEQARARASGDQAGVVNPPPEASAATYSYDPKSLVVMIKPAVSL